MRLDGATGRSSPKERRYTVRALICDDMQTERSNLQKILTGMGFVTESAMDGAEAVEKAAANPPTVVFLDIVMPKMDGFATCRALKANDKTKNVPVVMISTKGTPADKFWSQQQGAVAHLQKPATEADVQAALRQIGLT